MKKLQTPNSKILSIIPFLLVFISISSICNAQESELKERKQLFQFETAEEQTRSSQNAEYQRFIKDEKTKHIMMVSFPNKLYQYTSFNLYFDTKTSRIVDKKHPKAVQLIIERTDIRVLDDEAGFTWSGKIYIPKSHEFLGELLLINENDRYSGYLDIEGTTFVIHPVGNGRKHLLIQQDPTFSHSILSTENSKKTEPSDPSISKTMATSYTNLVSPCTQVRQKLLVVYTASAAFNRNISSLINTAIQETNQAYINSQITNLRVSLVHSQQVSFTETSDLDNDISLLQTNTQVNLLRDQYDADAVILITNSSGYANSGRAVRVLARDATEAFAIVPVLSMNASSYLFVHELGHIQGADHHPDDLIQPNSPFGYNYGHRFSYMASLNPIRQYKHTMMSYAQSGVPNGARIPYFSNPNITYRGENIGILNERDNHRVLENTAVQIADFRQPNELHATPNVVPLQNNLFQFTASACGGYGTVAYEWRFGTSFNTYGPVESTSQSFSQHLPPGTNFIKLTVTSGAQSFSTYSTINVPDPSEPCIPTPSFPCEDDPIEKRALINDELPLETALDIAYPNPFNPTTSIRYSLSENHTVLLEVFNLNGTKVATLTQGNQNAGRYTVTFNASNLPSGTYIVRLSTENMVQTQKITLIK